MRILHRGIIMRPRAEPPRTRECLPRRPGFPPAAQRVASRGFRGRIACHHHRAHPHRALLRDECRRIRPRRMAERNETCKSQGWRRPIRGHGRFAHPPACPSPSRLPRSDHRSAAGRSSRAFRSMDRCEMPQYSSSSSPVPDLGMRVTARRCTGARFPIAAPTASPRPPPNA